MTNVRKKNCILCVFFKKKTVKIPKQKTIRLQLQSVTAAAEAILIRQCTQLLKKKKKKKHMVTCNIKKIHVIQKTNGVLKPISVMKMLEFFVICIIKCI
jgi:chromate transport protein ChrA